MAALKPVWVEAGHKTVRGTHVPPRAGHQPGRTTAAGAQQRITP